MFEDNEPSEFEKAGDEQQLSLAQEFLLFVMENKKWWLIPILVVLALVGILIALGTTGVAPSIYPLL